MIKKAFLSFVCASAIVLAGAVTFAQEITPTPTITAPGATELPFVNEGANRPVLQPLSPDGVTIDEHALIENKAAGAHAKKGLPQFDVTTFARQIFWLTLTFAFMYAVFARKTLPTISAVLENRRERVSSDVRAAEALKKEVDHVRAEYETAMANAQSDAQKLLMGIQTDLKRTLESRDAEFKVRADQAIDALEGKIENGRTRVLAELNDLAANLAVDISNRIAGVKADASAARNIIDAQSDKVKAA